MRYPAVTRRPSKPANGAGEISDDVLGLFGRDIIKMTLKQRASWVDRALAHWRTAGFPYPCLSPQEVAAELANLSAVDGRCLAHVLAKPSMVGLRLANSFHPQMWSARVRGRSPVQVFADDALLRRCLEKAPLFWPDRSCWSARSVRIAVSLQNRSRVANFRPTVARALIDSLTGADAEVLDFSAGYGGRLLGAATLSRRYAGIDPAAAQCVGLRRMSSELEAQAAIYKGRAEHVMNRFPDRAFDLVFSSPPYFRLERYSDEPTQSYRRYPTYEQWATHFLKPVIENSHRVLRKGGRLAINGSNGRFPIATDTRSFATRLFGAPERVYKMKMSTNPADKARRGNLLREEPILLFRK